MSLVTCHTDGCGNSGVPIEMNLSWTDEDGAVHPIESVCCGPCGQPITDISDTTEGTTSD